MKLITLTENEVFITFVAIAILLVSAYVCGKIMERIKAPKVVGEILGGILLGDTFLAALFPEFINGVFQAYPEEGKVLNVFYQLGLVFLMFSSGFNTRIEFGKKNRKIIGCLFIGSTLIPMLAALPFAGVFQKYFVGEEFNKISYVLVFVIGVAITSIPVISKIFFDMGVMNTQFADMVLTVSTFQDLCLWILLNIATRTVTTGNVNVWDMLLVVALTIGMFAVAKVVTDYLHGYKRKVKATDFYTISFIALFLVTAILTKLGINIMYSAFLVGYIVKALSEADGEAKSRMQSVADFSFSFFVPIYFALVGIQLNLLHNFSLIRFIAFFAVAFVLEAIGTFIMLLFTNLKKQAVINFAVTMNARGGPGIVLATTAYAYGIISIEFFAVLVLTTMLSSLIAGYWLRNQKKKDETIFTDLTK